MFLKSWRRDGGWTAQETEDRCNGGDRKRANSFLMLTSKGGSKESAAAGGVIFRQSTSVIIHQHLTEESAAPASALPHDVMLGKRFLSVVSLKSVCVCVCHPAAAESHWGREDWWCRNVCWVWNKRCFSVTHTDLQHFGEWIYVIRLLWTSVVQMESGEDQRRGSASSTDPHWKQSMFVWPLKQVLESVKGPPYVNREAVSPDSHTFRWSLRCSGPDRTVRPIALGEIQQSVKTSTRNSGTGRTGRTGDPPAQSSTVERLNSMKWGKDRRQLQSAVVKVWGSILSVWELAVVKVCQDL